MSHEHAAAETVELVEVEREEAAAEAAAEPEPEPIPAPPETVIGLIHEQGSLAATVTQLTEDVAGLGSRIDALRAEIAGIARVEAEQLLDQIIAEGESGEMQAEAEHRPAAKPRWWESLLAG